MSWDTFKLAIVILAAAVLATDIAVILLVVLR